MSCLVPRVASSAIGLYRRGGCAMLLYQTENRVAKLNARLGLEPRCIADSPRQAFDSVKNNKLARSVYCSLQTFLLPP